MLVETLLGTLVGGLTSVIPGVLSWLQRKDELKHEMEMSQMRLQLATQTANLEMDVLAARADSNEGDSLRRHDSSIDDRGFIGALRRSVRPVITYLFFALFVFIKVVALWAAINQVKREDWIVDAMVWSELLPVIWDTQTAAIFGAIMGFWFGGRAIEKMMGKG